MRQPIIAGNWKMYKNVNEAIELVNNIKREVYDVANVGIVVCPTFTNLSDVGQMLVENNVALGAQNCYWEKEGAFTGEVSVDMLKSVGCKYVIIGHSERRKYFGETDETVNMRIKAAIESEIVPILCVGETLEEREASKTIEIVETQIKGALKGFSEKDIVSLVIAYEPVWAIGTGLTATPDQAQEIHAAIRKLIAELYSDVLASSMRIIYGGSAKPENIEELMREEDIDGGLIGGASLKPESFIDMIKKTSKLYEGTKD